MPDAEVVHVELGPEDVRPYAGKRIEARLADADGKTVERDVPGRVTAIDETPGDVHVTITLDDKRIFRASPLWPYDEGNWAPLTAGVHPEHGLDIDADLVD